MAEALPVDTTWLDRLALFLSPEWGLGRLRAKMKADLLTRYYDAAGRSRRTSGWRHTSGDGNAATDRGIHLRDHARDLVRNNPWARRGSRSIANKVIGWGIQPSLPTSGPFQAAWKAWADTPLCDADGRHTLHGLARLAFSTTVQSGECLVRRRMRRVSDGLPIPLQLQVLEPDYLDDSKDENLETGGRIIQGVEFSPIGDREAYWLFPDHPGQALITVRGTSYRQSVRIPASEILHLCYPDRPGQVRDVSWFAPIVLRLKDLDDYEDASLMKQKVAACLAVILTDSTGAGNPIVQADDSKTPGIDLLQPGVVMRQTVGDAAEVVNPPSVNEYGPYTTANLRGIAAGLGIGYEDLTGDFQGMPFSAARMSRIQTWENVDDWRWNLVVPQFYDPIWAWAVQMATVIGVNPPKNFSVTWTAPPMPMLDPGQEGLAYIRNIRGGLQSWSEVQRELGQDPRKVRDEIRTDFDAFDAEDITLDCDPRNMTQAGQLQGEAAAATTPDPTPPAPPPAPDAAASQQSARINQLVEMLGEEVPGLRTQIQDIVREAVESAPRAESAPQIVEQHHHHNIDARTFVEAGAIAPPAVTVDARMTEGAITIGTPSVNVDARTMDARVIVAPGAIAASPPPAVNVDARTFVAEGAIAVAPPTVNVDAKTSIAEGAVSVSSPVNVAAPPPAHVQIAKGAMQVSVEQPPERPSRRRRVTKDVTVDEKNRVQRIVETHEDEPEGD